MDVSELSPELQKLLLTGRLSKRTKGQIVQSTEGQKTINLVRSGYIKRYLISNTGNLGVEVIYGKSDIFPLTLMFKTLFNQDIYEGPEVYYYEAMCDTQLYTVDIAVLVKAVEQNPMLYRDLLQQSGKRLHSTLSGLENLTLRSAYNRVAHKIAYLASQFGESKAGDTRICVPLTHQDLADMLSLTRETVSTCMVKLREEKLIKGTRHIIVPNLEKLSGAAHS